jgi:restriction system protein
MKAYYRLMLGQKSAFAAGGFAGNFVGTDFGIQQNLEMELTDS